MKPPTMRSSHQPVARISVDPVRDVFQSSCTSWSSKIIATARWRAASGCAARDHDSRYSRVYSSKSATVSPGGTSGRARAADELAHAGRDLVGVDLVAEQHERVRPAPRVLPAHVAASTRRASTSRPRGPRPCAASTAARAARTRGRSPRRSGTALARRACGSGSAGYGGPASGQTRSPSSRTSYGVVDAGSSPVQCTSA